LPVAAQRLAAGLGVSSAAIELREVAADERRLAFPLEWEGRQVATLVLPASLPAAERGRVQERIVPALGSILAAARHRAELQNEVVETAALRRNDEMKTALLRSVSHDLRTPVTAILTAAAAFDSDHPTFDSVAEARDVITLAGTRLSQLIDKLLDLSQLEAGRLEPRLLWYSIEEVLLEAIEQVGPEPFSTSFGRELPLLRGDPGQLERAFANVLENASRYGAGKPVSVRARQVGKRIRVRIVDQGPGSRWASRSGSSCPSTARAMDGAATRARAWVWRSPAVSSRSTGAGSRSSPSPGRARASWSSSRSRPILRPREPRARPLRCSKADGGRAHPRLR